MICKSSGFTQGSHGSVSMTYEFDTNRGVYVNKMLYTTNNNIYTGTDTFTYIACNMATSRPVGFDSCDLRPAIATVTVTIAGSSGGGGGCSFATQAMSTTCGSLTVNAGTFAIYAGDDAGTGTPNNDMCVPPDTTAHDYWQDNGTSANITCSAAESAITLAVKSTTTARQTTTATINDIVIENVGTPGATGVKVTAKSGNLVNGASTINNVVLGTDPEKIGATATSDTSTGAPTLTDAGKLFCYYNPQAGTLKGIYPQTTKDNVATKAAKSSAGTTISTSTDVSIYTLDATAPAGIYSLDGLAYSCRLPAFVTPGSYTQTIAFTIGSY
jgi:hypothetical protein